MSVAPLSASSLTHALSPLGGDWRDILDRVARKEGFVGATDVQRLGALVAGLSAAYNDRSGKAPAADDRKSLNARLLFSFVRDVPKAAGAVRELARAGLLPASGKVSLLDLGAGLGAMTWGIARSLPASVEVEAELVDRDARALALASAIARERAPGTLPAPSLHASVSMRTRVGGADSASRGRYDLVVAGQVLSELDRAEAPARRVAAHVALVQKWLGLVAENGALVIVEPALRDRTRHLHHVRDALLLARGATSEAGGSGVTVFAPCLHGGACPMLARETDWCHEDLPIDLPEWLVPVARAAGLRFEGLTFSYIVLRRDGVTLASVLGAPSMFRDVSGLLRTKGKTERTLCGVTQGFEGGGLKGMRLDRAESEANAAWTEARRGDVLRFDPPLDPEKPRVAGSTQVTRA